MNQRRVNDLIHRLDTLDTTKLRHRLHTAITRDDAGTPTRDGYPTGARSAGGDDAGSSTETAAIANADGATNHDQLHDDLTNAIAYLADAIHALDACNTRLDHIDQTATPDQPYDPSGHCLCCGRWVEGTAADRIRSGYCDTDYRAWIRSGRPDRPAFERQRRAELDRAS